MLNVYDEPPAVDTLAWSVCPLSVVMDIPTAEIPKGCDGTLTVSPYAGCASLSLLLLLVLPLYRKS
jgi:hypothetical protein